MIGPRPHRCDFDVGPGPGRCTICGEAWGESAPTPEQQAQAEEAARRNLTCPFLGELQVHSWDDGGALDRIFADPNVVAVFIPAGWFASGPHAACPGTRGGIICGCACLECADARERARAPR